MGRSLAAILEHLSRIHSFEEPLTDALGLILWENIGYLVDDRRRGELFGEFERRVGLEPAKIARAPDTLLLDISPARRRAPRYPRRTLAT
jgi:hypothetical protein